MAQNGWPYAGSAYLTIRRTSNRKAASRRKPGQRLALVVSIGFLLVAFVFGFVWVNHRAVQVGYEITRLNEQQMKLIDLNRKFNVELANLTALDRLEKLARKELGLISPRPDQVTVLE